MTLSMSGRSVYRGTSFKWMQCQDYLRYRISHNRGVSKYSFYTKRVGDFFLSLSFFRSQPSVLEPTPTFSPSTTNETDSSNNTVL
jgi:hypothetical protein